MYDVVVCGGGPAGLAVALGAARAGMTVAVLERRDGVIDKACGEGLMPGALSALGRLGIDPPGRDIRGITYRQGSDCVSADFRQGRGRAVRRTALHAALRAAADDLGVAVILRRCEGFVQDATHVEVAGLSARYLVAADGLHSALRRSAGLARPSSALPRWGQRRHYAMAPYTDHVDVTWSTDSEVYVTPVAADTVGVAVLSSARRPFDVALVAFPELAARLSGAQVCSSVRGAGPLRQRVSARTSGRVLLVGDAAGYIDALTGEGLALALSTAAELVECLGADRPEDYDRRWSQVSRRSRWLTSALLWSRTRPLTANRVVPVAARLPRLFAAAVDQLAG